MASTQHDPAPPRTGRLAPLLYNLRDTASSSHHSPDFELIRGEYLRTRILLVGIAFALLAPLWIGVDYLLLPPGSFAAAAVGRVLMAAGLLGTVAYAQRSRHQPQRVRRALVALLAVPALFCMGLLACAAGPAMEAAGYGFAPLLLVAVLGVFPLTLIESLSMGLVLLAVQVLASLLLGQLLSPHAWQNLWLMAVLLLIAAAANHSQISTLLRLYRQASLDPLTQLLNRGHLHEQLGAIAARRAQQHAAGLRPAPLAMLMFDLDHFKSINDTYGHAVGDQVLVAFARTLRRSLPPPPGICARYGGEEFCAVLPATSLAQALALAEQIRASCHAHPLTLPDGRQIDCTVSIGATALRDGETFDALLQRADQLLYQAKYSGRDRVDSNA
ncbi:MAG: Response regulator PleD [Paracidovorax wautersii]|uniref:diguanylate cyclase n=1 Tax=Paracidovorax wautersii TaxID=1177982 RepID=A0A7V8FN41_9BURK|nr:MAG: Response regulator PleD [Paracidovorax wautersii]